MDQKQSTITDAEIVKHTTGTEPDNKKLLLAFVAGILAAVVGWYVYGLITAPQTLSVDGEYPAVVATVDGEAIQSERFTQSLEQSLAFATSQGADITDETVLASVRSQALDSVINTRLLVQAATAAGYEATDEAVEAQIANLIAQYGGEEAFNAEVQAAGLDPDTLRSDVAEQIAVDEYLRTDVVTELETPTEEEIIAFYEELVASGQELPALEEIRAAVTSQIAQDKEQALVLAHIETLRASADIEIAI